jgi:transposase
MLDYLPRNLICSDYNYQHVMFTGELIMTGYISGESRSQSTLFPEALDDYISVDNPIRFIDAFVDELQLTQLGFLRTEPCHTGRPGYSPATMLKLYLYGYLNRIQSSRRLEREAQRNVELMWLIQRLAPDFKTIADFRKDNGKGIKNVCRTFITLCRKMNMFADAVVAVDGSKFKAVNNTDRNYTQATIKRRIERTEKHIEDYLAKLDAADKNDVCQDVEPLKTKLDTLKAHLAKLQAIDAEVQSSPDKQVSLTDPDCRSMKSRSIGRTVGYNVQTAVDTKHHLIVAHYVTRSGTDRGELNLIGQQAQEAIGKKDITVLADKGYYSGDAIKAAQDEGMTPVVPKTMTSANTKKGMFNKNDFIYHADRNSYTCPAGQVLPYAFESCEDGRAIWTYTSTQSCKECRIRSQCTTSKTRRVRRWEHEDRLDKMEAKLKAHPESMIIRKSTVEHPFGTIKSWMGATHFLTRRLHNVSTEMSLHVLAYNMKRMLNIMDQSELMAAVRA